MSGYRVSVWDDEVGGWEPYETAPGRRSLRPILRRLRGRRGSVLVEPLDGAGESEADRRERAALELWP